MRLNRGRVTITNVVYLLVALVAMAALWPVFAALLESTAGGLMPEEQLVYSSMLPLAVLVILGVIYIEARAGGS